MGQKYGELAQVYKTGEDFEYDTPSKPTISGDEDTDGMERAIYMERMAQYRKAKVTQKSTNIQNYTTSYTRICAKSYFDDPLWGEVEKKQDPKGLMIPVTKIMLLSSS